MKGAEEGIENLESLDVLKVRPLTQFGSPIEILREFGGKERFLAAARELEGEIYRVARETLLYFCVTKQSLFYLWKKYIALQVLK